MSVTFKDAEPSDIIKVRHMNSYFLTYIKNKDERFIEYCVIMLPDHKGATASITLRRIRTDEEWNGMRNIAKDGVKVSRFEAFEDLFRLASKLEGFKINTVGKEK